MLFCCILYLPFQAYDSGDGMLAARLWWLLAVAGHPTALVLQGGWDKWKAEGRTTELYEPCTLKVGASQQHSCIAAAHQATRTDQQHSCWTCQQQTLLNLEYSSQPERIIPSCDSRFHVFSAVAAVSVLGVAPLNGAGLWCDMHAMHHMLSAARYTYWSAACQGLLHATQVVWHQHFRAVHPCRCMHILSLKCSHSCEPPLRTCSKF